MNRLFGFLICAPLLGLACAGECAGPTGSAAAVEITGVRIGFDGKFKVGFWTPVWVTLNGSNRDVQGRLEITTPDPDGVPVTFSPANADEQVTIAAGKETTLLSYIKPGRLNGGLEVKLVVGDDANRGATETSAAAAKSFSFRSVASPALSSQRLVVTFGGSIDMANSVRGLGHADEEAFMTTEVHDASHLPDRWFGYEGVSTLAVMTSADGLLERLSSAQVRAIDDWVRQGGRLLLCVGSRGAAVLGAGSPWRTLGPGEFVEVAPLRKAGGLENYAAAKQRLDAGAKGGGVARVSVSVIGKVRGGVEAYEGSGGAGDRPLIVRYLHGLGQVTFVALDLDQPPLAEWPGRQRLVTRIIQTLTDRSLDDSDDKQQGQVVHVGYDDLSGQLRSALDQFSGVTLVAFSLVAILVVAYIVLIGPVDYFVLRYFGRLHWTWLTFGLVAVGIVMVALTVACGTKGDRLKINQVDLVDFDLVSDAPQIRGTSWSHIYSPSTEAYNLSLRPAVLLNKDVASPESGVLLSWQGLPGTGLGGLNSASGSMLFSDPYRLFPGRTDATFSQPAVAALPIQVSSTRSLIGRWWASTKIEPRCELTAESHDGLLRGRLTNPLPVELTDCVVLYGSWAFPLDRNLLPGEETRLSLTSQYRNLEWRLTRRRVSNENKDISTPWDGESFDVPRILEMMMFHDAAGGRTYTRLAHRYQAYLDMTNQLKMGRAILMGRGAEPATQLCRDGQPLAAAYDQHWTYYRVVLPVEIKKKK